MSNANYNNGRAFELICIQSLHEAINDFRPAVIVSNDSYKAAERAWKTLKNEEQTQYSLSAKSTIKTIFALEPNIIEKSDIPLRLFIQNDQQGEDADVRDIIIERKDIRWEIGLSIKHNHMAVKHSRLAKSLDFGEKWYGVPCSQQYWDDIKPIFDFLDKERSNGTYFRDLASKEDRIYVPILDAFKKELSTQINNDKEIPRRLIEYLLSRYDFYKVISIDSKRLTTIQSFNMFGTLNQASKVQKPSLETSVIKLPTNLLHIGYKPNSKTTLLMCFDNGWQFSFRIHNAKDIVEPSLKFDIQIVGMPVDVNIKYNCFWQNE